MIRIRPIVAMFIVFWAAQPSAGNALFMDLSSGEAIELYRIATAAIHSFDVLIEVRDEKLAKAQRTADRAQPEKNGVREGKIIFVPFADGEPHPVKTVFYRQIRQGAAGRIETLDPLTRKSTQVLAGQNDVWKAITPGTGQATLRPEPVQTIIDGADYRTLFSNARGKVDLLHILKTRKGTRVLESQGGASGSVVIDSPPEADTYLNATGFQIRLDGEHGFMPSQIDDYNLENGKRLVGRTTTIDEFARIAEGLWVPIRATTTFYDCKSGTERFARQKCNLTVDMQKSSWNVPVPEHLFDVELPRGTVIYDAWQKANYVVGETDTNKNLAALAEQGKALVTNAPQTAPSSSGYSNLTLGLVAFVIGCIALICLRPKWRKMGA